MRQKAKHATRFSGARARILLGSALALILLFRAPWAWAFSPPTRSGHVTDLTGTLSDSEKTTLDAQMTAIEQTSAIPIAVLVLPSLDGASIEDVGATTARAWGVGQRDRDGGVLLVIALGERRARIEVGKSLGESLTDRRAHDILRDRVDSELQQGRLYEGIYVGAEAIQRAATGEVASTIRIDLTDRRSSGPSPLWVLLPVAVALSLAFLLPWLLLRLWRRRGRLGRGVVGDDYVDLGTGGVGGSYDGAGGSFDGGGGADFTGGGGESGGGGSSDSY